MNDLADEREDDELEDDEVEEVLLEDERDIDRAFREMEVAKRRRAKAGEPAWRKLEQRRESRETAERISDLEDYDLDGVEVELELSHEHEHEHEHEEQSAA
jgi:hypothetical protein